MAASPLLVRLCPAPDAGEKPMLKLHSYFQSGKRSGGGECEVRTGPEPGTYWVDFQQERGTGARGDGRASGAPAAGTEGAVEPQSPGTGGVRTAGPAAL